MAMKTQESDTFSLKNFEGPLEFLLRLIQKNEIDIYDVPIQDLTDQFLARIKDISLVDIDQGADFVGTTATLIWLKSRMLLPKHDEDLELEEDDPTFELIRSLVSYCKFKEVAKTLIQREEEQSGYYYRSAPPPLDEEQAPGLGIDHLNLSDLTDILEDALRRASTRKRTITEELWRVGDKMTSIRHQITSHQKVIVNTLFTEQHAHLELIVTFLAILELMKLNEIKISIDQDDEQLILIPHSEQEAHAE